MNNTISFYNGSYDDHKNNNLLTNRAFLYGDGLFETIIYRDGNIQFFPDHIQRLQKGLKILNISFNEPDLQQIITQLLHKNQLSNSAARIKIIIYRNTGGLYTPTNNSSSILITVQPLKAPLQQIDSISISKEVKLPKSPLGNLKTLNSLPYVLASIEKQQSNFDELIILNTDDEICECTSSNIFWRKKEIYYTPSLSTGCIAGIMRKNVIKDLKNRALKIEVGQYKLEDLEHIEQMFITNVTGIKEINDYSSLLND